MAKTLWEETLHIMTDAVSKNLHIEDRIAEAMQSEYKPLNLTCKSHAVEA